MKYATRHGNLVEYWGKPPATEHKKYREPVKVGERACKNWLCAWFRALVYTKV